jgi:HD superfamily phosphohydrolase
MTQPTIIFKYSTIHDFLYGDINISNIAFNIINSPKFQRLKNIKQLEACSYIFPSATHSRFEHSIGTYHLTNKILTCIVQNNSQSVLQNSLFEIKELSLYLKNKYKDKNKYILDEYICELIKIAALLHDIGHAPFSSIFNDFLTSLNIESTPMCRTFDIINSIIKNDLFLNEIIPNEHITFIKNIIKPTQNNNGFIYQIVNNPLNYLDVNKYEYILRDTFMLGLKNSFDYSQFITNIKIINNNITYEHQLYYDILALFQTRYKLYKQIYLNTEVISIHFMIKDIMILLDPILNFSKSIKKINDFCDLNDSNIISNIQLLVNNINNFNLNDQNNILQAFKIYKQINSNHLYKIISYIITNTPVNISKNDFKNITDINSLCIFNKEINFFTKKWFYLFSEFYNIKYKSSIVTKENISLLIPNNYNEYFTIIFYKEDDTKTKQYNENIINNLKKRVSLFNLKINND